MASANRAFSKPNVLLMIVDDLAWSDLACHGNPVTQTPHLDSLYSQSAHFTRYYSGPLCTPARASLMTGRYPFRTRAFDTYCGRSMMDPDEATLPEMLSGSGYRTGIFGKWHLGDCYPMRACDKGFEESLVHAGGGLRAPSSPTDNDGYFNPDLLHNGEIKSYQGYCTDIFTNAAIDFMAADAPRPFFAYLATNALHHPFEIEEEWAEPYRQMGINETHARVYGMLANLDRNVGRVLAKLDELKIADNTIVIFTSDHGWCPSTLHDGKPRFNADLRGGKESMYDGGLKVPCFWRWPNRFRAAADVGCIANPIDILPTLAEACGVALPAVKIDGISLIPQLGTESAPCPDRRLFVQWHRGDIPQRWRNCAVITQDHKLVDGRELYEPTDWPEKSDVADAHPEVVAELRHAYEAWFDDVSTTRGPGNFDPPPIHLGTPHECPTILTRQDWRVHGPDGWAATDAGHWEVYFAREGPYIVDLRFAPVLAPGFAHLQFGETHLVQPVEAGATSCRFPSVPCHVGLGHVEAWLHAGEQRLAPRCIDVR